MVSTYCRLTSTCTKLYEDISFVVKTIGGYMYDKVSSIDLAYIAGMFDGDGSFSLIKKKPEAEGRSPLYYPHIQFCNISKNIMEYLNKNLSGNFYTRKAHLRKDGFFRKDVHTWNVQKSTPCKKVLDKIIPFLVIKKERAQFLLQYIIDNPFKRGSVKLSEEALFKREQAYVKMKYMNEDRIVHENLTRKQASSLSDCPEILSYMAGLFDTDGSFSIKKEKQRQNKKSPTYSPVILLSMTDIRGINFIRDNCPYGKTFLVKAKSCKKGIAYRWYVGSKSDCIPFLKAILPYLKLKKDKAEVLLQFCENYSNTSYCRAGITEEELSFRESCYQRLISCNNMGSINLL